MPIRTIGIVANIRKEKAVEYANILKAWIEGRGLSVYFDQNTAIKLGAANGYSMEQLAEAADMIVVFGGDGTFLHAARSFRKYDVPLLGINLGGFGYLTVVNLSEMYSDLEKILEGDYRIEKRMMLDVTVMKNGTELSEYTVLNDAVITRDNLRRLVDVEAHVDDRYLTTYRADGLIISTPTGSTAYSLSAGGPIIFPELDSIILNPICPHTLTNRPVILPGNSIVTLSAVARDSEATLTLDGQVSLFIDSAMIVEIKRSKYVTTLIDSPHRDYLEILRTKLGWGGAPTGH